MTKAWGTTIAAVACCLVTFALFSIPEARGDEPNRFDRFTFLDSDDGLKVITPSVKSHGLVVRSLETATELNAFEGLPHPDMENELFEVEKKRGDMLKIIDWSFYRNPIELGSNHKASINQFLNKSDCFLAKKGWAGCGGFHPDWCLVWSEQGRVVGVAQFCFGCHEYKITNGKQTVYGYVPCLDEMERVLDQYRVNRPMPQPGGGSF